MGAAVGFFDVDDRLRRLSDVGDQLEAYGGVVDFETFRPELEKALLPIRADRAVADRPTMRC
jgi:IS5 family transposase